MNKVALIILSCGWALAPAAALGYTFDEVDVEAWTGIGDNEAMWVVDFGGGHSYAFGYCWDGGSPTGWDMLKDLLESSGSTFSYAPDFDEYGTPITVFTAAGGSLTAHGDMYTWGTLIEGIGYDGYSLEDHYYTTGEVIAYWNSTDGENWSGNLTGVTGRALSNGDWDGYSSGRYDNSYNLIGDVPTVPTPEPATMAILAAGAAFLMKKNRPLRKA